MKNLNIPVGVSDFEKIRKNEYYYIDKSGLIDFMNRCLNTPQKLICVSRPRRFGKSFATKMLSSPESLVWYCYQEQVPDSHLQVPDMKWMQSQL